MIRLQKNKKKKAQFFCPLGVCIAWSHKLEYKECPIGPSFRDMSECKNCKLRVDEKWIEGKETWREQEVKKKKKRKRAGKQKGPRK